MEIKVNIMDNAAYFKDKVCIVTGANSGIGYALSEELLNRGATVYMLGRSREKVEEAAKKLSQHKDRVHTIIADVTKQQQVEAAIKGTAAEAGRLDMLFNNAGIGGTLQFETATIDDWKNIIDVNVWSVIYGVHTAVPIMLKQGFGHIVNTSSIAGLVPPPFQALYSLTKFGVTGLTECLRYEYAEKNIRFSVICPANIATPIFQKGKDGTVYNEIKIPEDAYPADKTARYVLDQVAQQKGVIVVPEHPFTEQWRLYASGSKEGEEQFMQMARDRRAAYERGGNYY